MGRPSNWKTVPTELIRVPRKFIPQVLNFARSLDELPQGSFVQNSGTLQHCLIQVQKPGEDEAYIKSLISLSESVWDEAEILADRTLTNELKGLTEGEKEQFLVLLANRVFSHTQPV